MTEHPSPTASGLTDQQLNDVAAIASRVADDPFYVSDCEGSLQVWREKALTHVRRDQSGEIEMYSFPSTYKVTDQIIELDLSTWDPGEDATDDQQRQDICDLVEARAALPVLLDTIRRQSAELAASRAQIADEIVEWSGRQIGVHVPTVDAIADILRAPAWVEAVRAASAPPAAPPRRTLTPNEYDAAWHAVEGAAGDEGADPGTVLHAVLDRLDIEWQDAAQPATSHPATEDLAAADNPTMLRWGLNDVLWSDDDSVIVLLSGPDREAYWLEVDPERAAVLREDLAGPDGAPSPERDALIAELLPAWEAMYEPGNVSDHLIGYANSEAAAKGAAEAWLRSQAEVTGRLEWERWSTDASLPDGYDALFELIERHDDGIDTGPGIAVRRRTTPA